MATSTTTVPIPYWPPSQPPKVCPTCGTCPTCGKKPNVTFPVYQSSWTISNNGAALLK